jgi:nucleoside-diphosphate-sugar epimerase
VLWKEYPYVVTKQTKVLVTGATGFLGKRLAKRLVDEGYPVRALARKLSNVGALKKLGVEIAFGDLGDESSIAAAVKGVDVVVHAAAGTSGTAKDSDTATIQGTRNVLEACRTNRVKKLVYISSCNVYEVAGYTENQVVTEEAQLERFPLRRGHYSAAKLQAEALVTVSMNHDGCPTVVLRPGTIYGPGAEVFTNMIGVSLARRIFVVFGDGTGELPLVHVDNAVDAIVECIRNGAADNQVFNVVDQDLMTKKTYMERVIKPLYPNAIVIYVPMSLLLTLTRLQEKLLAILGKQPFLTVYRLVSSQKRIRYSTSKIEKAIGWRSHVTFEQGVEHLMREQGRAPNIDERRVVP